MLIGIDACSLLTPNPRGEGKTLLRLYEELAIIKPNWRFLFYGSQNSAIATIIHDRIPNSQIKTFRLPGYRWNCWENLGLPMQALLHGVDVLHCASSGTPIWSPIPVVMTVHDLIPLIMDDGLPFEVISRFKKRLQAGCSIAQRVITVSENTRQDLIDLMPIDPSIIEVIPWGTDLHYPSLNISNSLQNEHVIIGFGGSARRKNTQMLVRMFAHVAARASNVVLKVIGITDNIQRTELEQLSSALGISGRVKLLTFITESDLVRIYNEALCLVYISLYEGFGLPPLEAMSYGIPVVASNCSSIPEVVCDAGLLVNPNCALDIAQAVLKILNDPALRKVLYNRSIAQAQKFSWKSTALKTATLLQKAVSR